MANKEDLRALIQRLHDGEDAELVKQEFKEKFGTVASSEIAEMERDLIMSGLPIEEVQRLCNIHAAVFEGSIEDIHSVQKIDEEPGHPLFVFRRENDGLEEYLKNNLEVQLEKYEKNPNAENKVDLLAEINGLTKLDRHYSRKENLFFPYLEREGVTAPPKVMWAVDDDIRDLWKALLKDEAESTSHFVANVKLLIEEVRAMIKKENEILAPLLIDKLKPADWKVISEESYQIGYAFNGGIEGASPSDAAMWLEKQQGIKHDEPKLADEEAIEGLIKLPSGRIQLTELVYMLNTIPTDLTYTDAEDNVAYFSEGKHPVFARTRTIIGRDVRNCHPPKSLPVVNQLLEDFKAGTKDEETRVIIRGTKILLVRYFAVRDEAGKYIGTVETTEEISEILKKVEEAKAAVIE